MHRSSRSASPTRMGDIGDPVKHIELEPLPTTVPVVEPAAPSVPLPEPVPA